MTLKGAAFLALWNDFDPARDEEYNCWHTYEHVPERVGIAGILSGRRYVARERSERRYFTLYELDDLAALDGPQYKEVVDRPTEWSAAMRPSFRNFLRAPCATIATLGAGIGGHVVTFRLSSGRAPEPGAAQAALAPLVESSGIIAVHLGRADTDAKFPVPNAAVRAAAGTQLVLLVEGLGRVELEAAAPRIAEALKRGLAADESIAWESYDLTFVIERAGLASSKAARQPPRPDLRRRWS